MTPKFTDELTVTQLSGKAGTWRRWTLRHPLIFVRYNGHEIVCPEGFISDGPTIPRFLWAILPVWGSWGRAGILHDYLCFRLAVHQPDAEAPTRTDADVIFYEAMAALGVGFLPRWLLYIGVRIGTLTGVRADMVDYNVDLLGGA